ncbi:DNA (cytosine-5)-methyltransferase 2 [Abeliophyllum distichum]|uniref:DNA (Cytosine-5)-methyltransferase 2 n=1 Tax=Abeliophyllum distichum TaxID=126358 RepID=A0ABD1VB97_9LAMI
MLEEQGNQMGWRACGETSSGAVHRKANADADKIDRARAEKRKGKGLPTEYYCKSLYWLERGAFFSLPFDETVIGYGICHSCKLKETNNEKELFKGNASKISLYTKLFKSGRNVGLKAFVICQLLDIIVSKERKLAKIDSTQIKVRIFHRLEDISPEKAYSSDIREVTSTL